MRGSILATDIDPGILAVARAGGPYGPNDRWAVPKPLAEQYLEERESGCWVQQSLRHRVKFANLNLLAGAFPRGQHLILCRNVIIYCNEDVKRDLMRRFRGALAPGGILFIGATESILDAGELLPQERRWRGAAGGLSAGSCRRSRAGL